MMILQGIDSFNFHSLCVHMFTSHKKKQNSSHRISWSALRKQNFQVKENIKLRGQGKIPFIPTSISALAQATELGPPKDREQLWTGWERGLLVQQMHNGFDNFLPTNKPSCKCFITPKQDCSGQLDCIAKQSETHLSLGPRCLILKGKKLLPPPKLSTSVISQWAVLLWFASVDVCL